MKKLYAFSGLIFWIFLVSCNLNTKNTEDKQASTRLADDRTRDVQIKGHNKTDSIKMVKDLTHQDIYSVENKWGEEIGALKHSSATLKKSFNYYIQEDLERVQIELYYIENRIITIEKRVFNKNQDQIKLYTYDFTKDNVCVSNTLWQSDEQMSYIYSMLWGELIKYDVNCNKIEIDSIQKKEAIESAKTSLDSIMQHFPGFTYTFNWK
jgi:hypothetical protein